MNNPNLSPRASWGWGGFRYVILWREVDKHLCNCHLSVDIQLCALLATYDSRVCLGHTHKPHVDIVLHR